MRTLRQWPIAKNLELIADLEAKAVRITGQPGHRCFEMPDGQLLTIRNEQPPDSDVEYVQHFIPLTREDAEDFYEWLSEAES